jgi:hypothetical protein
VIVISIARTFLAAGRGFVYARDPEKNGPAAPLRILFRPRLGPLGWFFFESRRTAGAKFFGRTATILFNNEGTRSEPL